MLSLSLLLDLGTKYLIKSGYIENYPNATAYCSV